MKARVEEFGEIFGEENVRAIMGAAHEHRDDTPFTNYGGPTEDDEFRWAILACLGFECMTRFKEYHGITAPWDKVDAWLKEPEQRAWLRDHTGDVDYIGMLCGVYDEYVKELN